METRSETLDDDADVYHIVCHDCEAESLFRGRSEAEQRLSDHESETGHHVEFAALNEVDVAGE